MFSSNQQFKVSSQYANLAAVIDLAIRLDDKLDMLTRKEKRVKLAYQITGSGLYCIGTGSMEGSQYDRPADGWQDFPFDYDPDIVASIVRQWLEKQPKDRRGCDGMYEDGFICFEPWDRAFETETDGIENENECIVCIKPFQNYYAQ